MTAAPQPKPTKKDLPAVLPPVAANADAALPQVFKKDVALIHIHAPNINLVPRKLMNALVFFARDQQGPMYYAPVDEILASIGYTSRDLTYFHAALQYLMQPIFKWDILDNKGRSHVGASSFVPSYDIIDGNILEYTFSEHLKREGIKNPDVFAVLEMAIIRTFSKVGGLALYETCKRFVDLRYTPWLDIDVWRRLLDGTSASYDDTAKFIDKIVKPALKEVNKHSDIHLGVKPEFQRVSRRIARMRFTIQDMAQKIIPYESTTPDVNPELLSILTNDFGITPIIAAGFLTAHSEDYIRSNIAVVQTMAQQGKIKKSVSGYLVKALKEDYRQKETAPDREKRVIAEKAEQDRAAKLQHEALAREAAAQKTARIWKYLAEQPREKRASIFAKFVESKPGMYQYTKAHSEAFVERGTIDNSPMVAAALATFVEQSEGLSDA